MNKNHVLIITCLVITLLISCTPSASVIETAIVETAAAVPTFTRTLAPTATENIVPTATLTPVPTLTFTPEPEVGKIPGLSRNSLVNGILVGFLGLNCNTNGMITTCKAMQFDTSLCGSIDVTVLGKSETTVDMITVFVTALTSAESHENCQDVLGLLASIPYSEATPEIAQSWVLENLKDYGPDSENSMKIEKTFSGVDFKVTANGGMYFLIIE